MKTWLSASFGRRSLKPLKGLGVAAATAWPQRQRCALFICFADAPTLRIRNFYCQGFVWSCSFAVSVALCAFCLLLCCSLKQFKKHTWPIRQATDKQSSSAMSMYLPLSTSLSPPLSLSPSLSLPVHLPLTVLPSLFIYSAWRIYRHFFPPLVQQLDILPSDKISAGKGEQE